MKGNLSMALLSKFDVKKYNGAHESFMPKRSENLYTLLYQHFDVIYERRKTMFAHISKH